MQTQDTPSQPSPAKILVVDDEPHNLLATARILRAAGYDVFEANTGTKGLALVKDKQPELVLLDVVMPDVDGFEICRQIKATPALSQTYVILLSGVKKSTAEQASGLENGADGYIARPISNRELLARVEALLRLKETEQQLRQSEATQRAILNSMAAHIAVIDKDGYITDINTAWKRFATENGDPELAHTGVGQNYLEICGPVEGELTQGAGVARSGLEAILEGTLPQFTLEYPCHAPHKRRWFLMTAVPMVGPAGGAVISHMDITRRKLMEQELTDKADDLTRSNQELEQFAYVASHDLQEPLRMVTSYLQLLNKRYKDSLDTDAREFIEFAVDGASRMKQLINDLLAFSRISTRGAEFSPVDCQQILERTLQILAITLEDSQAVITHHPLPTVTGDAGQLQQLFQNLVGNALKFKKEGVPPKLHIGVEERDDTWLFWVQDNGIGMKPEAHQRIFIIFQRLHTAQETSGTGIGLAICKRIIERHGGRIWVESQPGQGSTFYFTIPR